jgi:hypothetical protein
MDQKKNGARKSKTIFAEILQRLLYSAKNLNSKKKNINKTNKKYEIPYLRITTHSNIKRIRCLRLHAKSPQIWQNDA